MLRAALFSIAAAACGRVGFENLGANVDGDASIDGTAGNAPSFASKMEIDASGSATAVATLDAKASDLIVVAIDLGFPTPAISMVTDSLGDGYGLIEGTTDGSWRTYLAYATLKADGPVTVTATATSAPPSLFNARFFIYTNTPSVQAVSAGTSTDGSATGTDAATIMVPVELDNQLLLGFATSAGDTARAGTGFAERSTFDGDVVEDRVAPVAGMHAVTASIGAGSGHWTLMALAIRPR